MADISLDAAKTLHDTCVTNKSAFSTAATNYQGSDYASTVDRMVHIEEHVKEHLDKVKTLCQQAVNSGQYNAASVTALNAYITAIDTFKGQYPAFPTE